MRTRVSAALEGAGYEVVRTADVLEGLSKLYQKYPDVIIIASGLPKVQGEDAYLRIREVAYLPIIVLGSQEEEVEMLELGADALLVTYDRAMHTSVRIPLTEMGANVLVVEHGVAEMPGMQRMAQYLEQTYSGVQATFYCNEPAAVTVAVATTAKKQ